MTKPIEGLVAVNSTPPLPPTTTTTPPSASAGACDEGGNHSGSNSTSKAPDKHRKNHLVASSGGVAPEKYTTNNLAEERSVNNLDDEGLRALLDEAIAYKTPKDREGKSILFNVLLSDAEDEIRKKHAYNASGPARHFSTTAKKRQRQRRQPSSISENRTHAGSLNDLVNEELYQSTKAQRPKTVSSRQRAGGSLPCDVNAGASVVDNQYFMAEAAKQQVQRSKTRDCSDQLLANDIDAVIAGEKDPMRLSRGGANTYTTNATLQIDDGVTYAQLEQRSEATMPRMNTSPPTPQFSLLSSGLHRVIDKKLDENGNAVPGNSGHALPAATSTTSNCVKPTRKIKYKKSSETVIDSEKIEGHRADIIHNIDKLLSFIDGTEDKTKSKKLHKPSHSLNNEEKAKGSKRARKKSSSILHKSNSMEEISTTKMEEFSCRFEPIDAKEKPPLRTTKSNAERQSRHPSKTWVMSSEQLPTCQNSSTSAENLEIADFIYVTKKKKSKKRRNSLNQPGSEARPADFHSLQATSARRKSASSAPHSEKSVDSSDNESVHSLPLDANNKSQQISYADIAKSSERPKWNKPAVEKRKTEKPSTPQQPLTNNNRIVDDKASPIVISPAASANSSASSTASTQPAEPKEVKTKETNTNLSSFLNWPEIRNNKVNSAKTNSVADSAHAQPQMHLIHKMYVTQDWPSIISNTKQQPPPPAVAPSPATTNTPLPAAPPPTTKPPAPQQPPQTNPLPTTVQHQNSSSMPYVKVADKNSNKINKPNAKLEGSTNNVKNIVKHVPAVPQSPPQQTAHVNDVKPSIVDQHKDQDIINKEKQTVDVAVAVPTPDEDAIVLNNTQQVIQQVSEQQPQLLYPYKMPPNIRDVQSIEKMQMRQAQAQLNAATVNNNNNVVVEEVVVVESEQCTPPRALEATSTSVTTPSPPSVAANEKHRPAVVILSSGADRHVSDITFGFGINEQLLKGDNYSVCADFMSRFYLPEVPTQSSWDIDNVVDYIDSGWQEVLVQTHSGKVKYYTDEPKFSD